MNAVVEQTPKQPKSAYEQLPRRYRRFVDHFVSGKTATDAIRLAGCKSQHARSIASRLVARADVWAAIEEREKQAIADLGVRHQTVARELYWIATCDPRKLVDGEGVAIPLHQLPADIAACISAVDVENISSNGESGVRYKYKFWDKNKALEKLGLYLKLWEATRTNVNVDARSVTVNGANADELVRGFLDQARAIASTGAKGSPALSQSHGSVLPAALHDEPQGCGTPVDARKDSGSPGKS
jgi:hypothetical protein